MKTKIFSLFAAITVAAAALCGPILVGQPSWWDERNVLTNDPPDDYAVINQGQLKHLVVKGFEELEEYLPAGAGTDLEDLVAAWDNPSSGTDDFVALNLGQLKNLARLFYDRFGLFNNYPWNGGSPDDFALANIGQVKKLFSFDLRTDTSDNGIPDWWEDQHFNMVGIDPGADPSVSGLTNLQEYKLGTDPNSADSNGDGIWDGIAYRIGMNPAEFDYTVSGNPPTITLHAPRGAELVN